MENTERLTFDWLLWREKGFSLPKGKRVPKEVGQLKKQNISAVPAFSYWNDTAYGYIDSRKALYIPEYYKCLVNEPVLRQLHDELQHTSLLLIDMDAPPLDLQTKPVDLQLLKDAVNNEKRPLSHAYVIAATLLGYKPEKYARLMD